MSDELAEAFSNESNESNEPAAEAVEKEPEAAVEESTEAEHSEAEAVEESDTDTKVDKEEPEPTSEDDGESQKEYTANERALYKQAKEERRKRQELQQRLEDLEAGQQGEKAPMPDVFEDQEAFTDSLKSDFQSELSRAKLDIQREMMIEFKPDYLDVETAVIEEMQTNPVLKAELQKAQNVAKAVYEYGKKLEQFKEATGFNKEQYEAKLKADLEKEIREKLEQEYKGKLEADLDDASNLSPSLASARGNSGQGEKPIQELSDLF